MGFLASAIGNLLSPSPTSDYWFNPLSSPVKSGVKVDETTALTYSAVWCATRILSEGVAGLPLILYRRLPNGGKERAKDQLLYRLLHDEPNEETDSFQYFDQTTAWLVNSGNARSEIQRNGAGAPVALWPIHPTRVTWKRNPSGAVVYYVRNDDSTVTPIQAKDMLDPCGPLSDNGVDGKGVITQGREAIGMGIATERYGAAYFGNSALPSAVLTHPSRLKPEAEANMRRSWKALYGGSANAGEVAILQEGVTLEKLSYSPEDSQFLTTRQHNITEIARWYRVPPHMLADLSRATFSNIEEQGISFVVDSLRPWLVRWEKAITRKLIPEADRETYYAEFLVDALTRGDIAKRTAALQIQLMNGAINLDEWRDLENRNPLPDGLGQIHFHPANLMRLEAAKADDAPPAIIDGTQPAAEPTAEAEPQDASANIQASALNGGQISGMLKVSQLTVEETFNQEAARGMLSAAFPLLSPEQIDAIVDNLTPSKKPPAPAPMPFGGGPPKPEEEPPTEEPEADEEEKPELSAEQPETMHVRFTHVEQDGVFVPLDVTHTPWLSSARRWLHNTEATEAIRAAKHPERFLQWLDAFFAKHELKVADVLAPLNDGGKAARDHCRDAKEELLTASECQPAELEAAVTALGQRWKEMAHA